MLKRIGPAWTICLLILLNSLAVSAQSLASASSGPQPASAGVATAAVDNDRVRDGLNGPVRRVRTETARLTNKNGKMVEQPRVLLENSAYDLKGNKIENAYFPVAGATLTGKEVYKYDDKGNISEMTLQAADGSLLGKETYNYEYDFVGNWTKMTTAVAVIENGKLNFEPTEVTYRTISYYLDENLAKMVQPAANASAPAAAVNAPANGKAQPAVKENLASKPANAPAIPSAAPVDRTRMLSESSSVAAVGSVSSSDSAPLVKMEADAPAKPLPKPLLRPISGGVLNGTAINLPKPVYPDAARQMRASGLVTVDVIVDETGKVISARATTGPGVLRDVAVQAALRARFTPTKVSGQPVKVAGQIAYNFSLGQ
ncbi:MAG TPA: TonB family protein [Pyrinomonadaceae bacterium]|jgi:TonB family protein